MNTELPPPIPNKSSPNWLSRNLKWFVPLICIIGLSGILGFVALIFGIIKSSDAYVGAVATAKADSVVVQKLGAPIHEGYFVAGQVNTNGASGKAELTIPIRGAREDATIYAESTKAQGEWHFDNLIVQIDRTGERIDLLRNKDKALEPTSTAVTPRAGHEARQQMNQDIQQYMWINLSVLFIGSCLGLVIMRMAGTKEVKYKRLFYLFTTMGIIFGAIVACLLSSQGRPQLGILSGIFVALFLAASGYIYTKLKI